MEFQELFKKMVEIEASDLYLTVARPPMYRVEGKIQAIGDRNFTPDDLRALADAMMTEKQRREFAQTFEMNLAQSLPGLARFRVNILIQRGSVGLVIRRIKADIMSIDDMGLPSILKNITMTKRGLVLVVGATGSGKSTTLAAMIDHRNTHEAGHIITIEDPIEFVHKSKKCLVNQRELGVHTLSFANALKSALREDPDIVLVGEMRDLETIQLALTAAETGHLVFGTLHTSSAPKTIDRIIDAFPPAQQAQIRTQLSEALEAVLTQTLLKKKTGGRVAALEIMVATTAVRNLIREAKLHQIPGIMQASQKDGMQTMDMALVELATRGVVHKAEAQTRSMNPNLFGTQMTGAA